jgi:hypothetical protein
VFQKELYNGIPNVTVWGVLRKRLHLEGYELCIVQDVAVGYIRDGSGLSGPETEPTPVFHYGALLR